MTNNRVDSATRLVMEGRIDDAMELLRPLVREESTKADALGVMGLAYQRAEQIALSCYVYDEALALGPWQESATKWADKRKENAPELTVHEEFDDAGHGVCGLCTPKHSH